VSVLEKDYWKYSESMNSESFRDLMLTYGQEVWNYAFFMTQQVHLADDISQDVFFKVYSSIQTFRGDSSIKTWLISITRNIAINYRRSAFMRKVILVEQIFYKNSHPSAENEALGLSQSHPIWDTVLKLPLKYREVLILDAKYELTMKEMSTVLGISEGAVKSRLSRARQRVAAIWKEETEYERA
jgi:RNA polymerase sigma-70 factor, ECF subfamily